MKGVISSPGTRMWRGGPLPLSGLEGRRETSLPEDGVAGSWPQRTLQVGTPLPLSPCLLLEGVGVALGQEGESGWGPW